MSDLTFKELHQANVERGIQWGVPNDDAAFRGIELAGEVGEALNIVKKLLREGAPGTLSRAEGVAFLADELADVVICADRLAEAYGIDLGAAIRFKFNATSDKHGLTVRLPEK